MPWYSKAIAMENRENHIPTDGKLSAGTHLSCWMDSLDPIRYQPLDENLHADVVIVGGGLAGVSTAYCLARSGKRVVLLEDGYIGSGETGRTTAHLANALDDRFYELERIFGENISKLAAESHGSAIDFIEHIIEEENIDCDFYRVDGYLVQHPSDDAENMDREYEAARRAGLEVEKVHFVPGLSAQPGTASLRFARQAQFHPLRYLRGLCDCITALGGKIYTETHVQEIHTDGVLCPSGHRVSAAAVVVATNAPINSRLILPMKQFAFRTYAIAGTVKKGLLPRALWWDTGDRDADADHPPYHYVRTQPYNDTHDLLICGGEDHLTGLADAEHGPEEQRYDTLETWLRRHFPVDDIRFRWSGQVLEPMDCLGYIGSAPGAAADNIYVVSGDSGHGMTHGTLAGLILTDLITGQKNLWEELYSPSRFKFLQKGMAWIREFMTGYVQYLRNNPTDTDAARLGELPPDEGIIVKLRGHKYGVYRDTGQGLHFVSAKCTHMGCTVKWNNDEKSWDCPCHGSRFSYRGQVLNGPANTPLAYHSEHGPQPAELSHEAG